MPNIIFSVIKKWSNAKINKPAVQAPGSIIFSYKQLYNEINNLGLQLNNSGLKKNSKIAIVLPQGYESLLIGIAAATCSMAVPLNPEMSSKEFEYYFEKLKLNALVTKNNLLKDDILKLAEKRKIILLKLKINAKGRAILSRGKLTGSDREKFRLGKPDDMMFLLPTSGTTSVPKIVPLTHANIFYSAQNMRRSLCLTDQDRCFNFMPIFHVHGLMVSIATLFTGGTVFMAPKFDNDNFLKNFISFKPTWYTASPLIHQTILKTVNKNFLSGLNLRFIRSSSAPLPPEIAEKLERTFRAPVAESYGMTEAALQITSNPLPPIGRKPGSAGKPVGLELLIINDNGRSLKAGKTGEIIIKGKNIIKKYFHDKKTDKNSFIRGYLRTGDLGYLDREGYLYIIGRKKEMINKGGEKISPREIDEALLKHPQIEQAAAFSIPHQTLGEDIAAAVILKNNSYLTEGDIRKYLSKSLAKFKTPSRIIFADELPRTAAGKIKRAELNDKFNYLLKNDFKKPMNNTQKKLVQIWKEVLLLKKIGINDNFFELGGDSLRLNSLISKSRNAGIEISAEELLDNPTIFDLSIKIKYGKNKEDRYSGKSSIHCQK